METPVGVVYRETQDDTRPSLNTREMQSAPKQEITTAGDRSR